MSQNWFFVGINVVMVGGQIMIIFVGGKAFSVTPLQGTQWAISIILGAISIPVAVIIRLIPDEFIAKIAPSFMTKKRTTPVYRSEEDRFEWNRGIEEIRQELSFLKMVRGGRLNQLKFRRQNIRDTMKENFSHMFRGGSKAELAAGEEGFPPPSAGSHKRRRSRSNSAFAAAAMVPSIVAGSIGGWSPVERAKDAKGGELPPSNKSELEVPTQPRTSSEPVIHELTEESAPSNPPA
jgi:Ca2+-transporting ATPase